MGAATNRNPARLRVEIGGKSQLVSVESVDSGLGCYRVSWGTTNGVPR